MQSNNNHVAVLGASGNPERYAYQAQKILMEDGYQVYPINPKYKQIEGIACYENLSDIKNDIDTLTVYMNPKKLDSILPEIIDKKPKRVILNPGSESEEIINKLQIENISVMKACTLVLIKTGQF